MPADWVTIGRLYRARGLRGEIFAELDSSKPGREQKLKRVELVCAERSRVSEVDDTWWHQGRLVLKIAGIDSMTDAEVWEGSEIRVAPEDVEPPPEGTYSHADLIGCVVETAAHGVIGKVRAIEEFGSAPVLVVDGNSGNEILIPFVKAMLEEVDVAQQRIRMNLPEGVLEQ